MDGRHVPLLIGNAGRGRPTLGKDVPHKTIPSSDSPSPGGLLNCYDALKRLPGAGVAMEQPEVKRVAADASVGTGCSAERVTPRDAPGVWDVHLRCGWCGIFRFLLIEQMDGLSVSEQVRKEIERHGRRH